MNITCPNAQKLLEKAQLSELDELMRTFPEDERDGRTDLQILADEANYLLDLYSEPGTSHNLSLKNARAILRETNNGIEVPLLLPSFTPKYSKHHLEECKGIVAEHRRLKSLLTHIAKQNS